MSFISSGGVAGRIRLLVVCVATALPPFKHWDTEHASTRTHTRQAGACTLMLAHTRPTAGVPRTHVFTHMQLEITSLLIDGLLLVNRNGISVTHIETDMFNDSRTSRKVEVIRSNVLDSGAICLRSHGLLSVRIYYVMHAHAQCNDIQSRIYSRPGPRSLSPKFPPPSPFAISCR